jgi:hypothetical protein
MTLAVCGIAVLHFLLVLMIIYATAPLIVTLTI